MSLSATAAPVVRATLPVVGAHLDRITERFYARMFAARPELLRDLFNRGNQASGDQRRALAGSIAAWAGLLLADAPAADPRAVVGRIAHKHASLGITSEQYKIVHEHLFAAIGEVLGDAVTPEVAAAWDEVYWSMADALIAAEADLYRAAGTAEGAVWRPMRVTGRVRETADVVSFTLSPSDGTPAGPFLPGQYVSVQVEAADGARQIRQYSLISAPGRAEWQISVKRVRPDDGPAGEVSAILHDAVLPGDEITVSAPFGDLVLPDGDGPLLLASAGIGITPTLSMLLALARERSGRRVIVVHGDRGPDTHAHRAHQEACAAELPGASLHVWYEEPGASGALRGYPDLASLDLPDGVTALLCGPLPFLRSAKAALLAKGVPAERIAYEVFGPDLWRGGN
ncbi:globin domain-containing protein [Actinocorallia sp. A-T 12471]|uniref:globin domain-containing protein n=1 Tax=Actinocorallia sp. A-T 12471 TaxID=3089813 RepID=UPI0029CD0973|nr:globin domain-containing protein [Actinocorallia sp. A-T 12471]MDX6738901.1 globin domain-containing protein [Actinocorallia sp. A-T 12471]